MGKTHTVTLRVEDRVAEHIKQYCQNNGLSMNQFCQNAIVERLEKETVTDVMKTSSPDYLIRLVHQPAMRKYIKAALVHIPTDTEMIIMAEFPEGYLAKVLNHLYNQVSLMEAIQEGLKDLSRIG
jgi:hypothetical protein